MRNLSLGSRVALIAIFSSIVTVAVLLAIAYNELVRDFEDVLTQRQLLETENSASRVNQDLQIRLQALEAFSTLLTDGQNRLPLPRIRNLLGRQTSLQAYFQEGLVIFDERGVAIAENVHVPGRLGTSYADRQHFRKALASRAPVISRPIIGRTTGLPLLSFLAPIETDEGDLLGFAGGIINLAKASIIPRQAAERSDTLFKVLDTEHFIQVDALSGTNIMPDLPEPGENLIIDAALSGVTSGVVTDLEGKKWIYATRHLERVGWMFLRAVPYEHVKQPAWASFRAFLGISILAMLILAATAWALARAATRPLEKMSSKIRAMTRDGFVAARLKPAGPPEIRSVAIAFNQLMEEREALDVLKDQFVSTVSHELRTPLTSINGSLRLLHSGAAGDLPVKARAMVDVALRNSEQLQRLISDLLDFNKTLAGQMPINPETIEVGSAIEDACEGNAAMARHYRIPLNAEPSGAQLVIADPVRLRQILDNFISNAIKFSPLEGTVRVRTEVAASDRVRITVSDQGKGVPEHFLPRLFHRFAQAEAGSTRAKAGTGLGLAISRELASMMGGEVGYYYDSGAHFWVELPAADAEVPETGERHENP
ncbi:ATP-binding protein [uncultured Marinobacter sp.]|uniref:sensor histidine kinase n=1 Tax=uncultured Marinobacter sp. TaxID=187379 RepID=UPI0025FB6D6B|nr:ATP-binding protein [uncultured Marinobacter sp.]